MENVPKHVIIDFIDELEIVLDIKSIVIDNAQTNDSHSIAVHQRCDLMVLEEIKRVVKKYKGLIENDDELIDD